MTFRRDMKRDFTHLPVLRFYVCFGFPSGPARPGCGQDLAIWDGMPLMKSRSGGFRIVGIPTLRGKHGLETRNR